MNTVMELSPFYSLGTPLVIFIAALMILRFQRLRGLRQLRSVQEQLARAQSEFQQDKDQFRQLVMLIRRIHEYGVSPTGRIPWQELGEGLLDAAVALAQAEKAVLFRLNRETGDLDQVLGRGIPPNEIARLKLKIGEGILGSVAQLGKSVLVNAATDTSAHPAPDESFLEPPFIVFPIMNRHHVAGILAISKPLQGPFRPEQQRFLSLLADQGGTTLENLDLHENMQRFYMEIVETLTRAVDAKDTYTHGHSVRCRSLTRRVAAELLLPEQLIQQIEYGALLHDVGKIGIDDRILRKPGKLTPEDYEEIKKHPAIGYRILSPVTFLKPASSVVLYHQEWFNGQGYPEGLAGEEIPLGARIIAVVDAWDAMTSNRPYRQALPKSAAVSELRRQAGTQFDPKVVNAFLRVIDSMERGGLETTEAHGESSPPIASAAPNV